MPFVEKVKLWSVGEGIGHMEEFRERMSVDCDGGCKTIWNHQKLYYYTEGENSMIFRPSSTDGLTYNFLTLWKCESDLINPF